MKKYDKPVKNKNQFINRMMFDSMDKDEVWDYSAKKQKTNGAIILGLVISIYILLILGLFQMTGMIDLEVPEIMGQELCEKYDLGEFMIVRWNEGRYVQVLCEEGDINIMWAE